MKRETRNKRKLKKQTEITAGSAGFQRAWFPGRPDQEDLHAGSLRIRRLFVFLFSFHTLQKSTKCLHIARECLGANNALARALCPLKYIKRLILPERQHPVSNGYYHITSGKHADDAIGLPNITILDPCPARIHSVDNFLDLEFRRVFVIPWR